MAAHPLTRQGRQTVQTLIDSALHSPGGYLWWHSLPAAGRQSGHAIIKKWTATVLASLFPQTLLNAMLYAALSPSGIPDNRGELLYIWLVKNVYKGNVQMLYSEWLQLTRLTKQS